MKNRYYQDEQLESVKRDYEAGLRRVLINAAGGSGKTVFMSKSPKYMCLGGKTMILVHLDTLARQAADKVKRINPEYNVSIEMGDRYADLNSDVIVASVQTLGREGSLRIERFDPASINLIEVDEAHHGVSEGYMRIYDYFGMLDPNTDKLLVGVTATPGRGDGEPLAKVFQRVSHTYSLRQGIDDGYLCDIRAIKLIIDDEATDNQKIVKVWSDNAKERKTVVFTSTVKEAQNLSGVFRHYGFKADTIWADDPERDWKMARYQGVEEIIAHCALMNLPVPSLEEAMELEIQIMCNCGILTEGYDDWRISCVIMARPTDSQTLFIQCIVRGTRIPAGIENLKDALKAGMVLEKVDCLVIDVVNSTEKNSLITVPSIFGLAGDFDLGGRSIVSVVEELEKLQEENPVADLSSLQNLNDVKAAVEDAKIWDIKYPDEVERYSKFAWHKTYDGAYILRFPIDKDNEPVVNSKKKKKPAWMTKVEDRESNSVKISETPLGWEVYGKIDGKVYRGKRDDLGQAFRCGDTLILEKSMYALRIVKRETDWGTEPVSPSQKRLLSRLLKGKPTPPSVTKKQATTMISRLIASKVIGEKK